MSITTDKAIPYFDFPATESKDGTTYIQNFKVPLNGTDTATALELSLVGAKALRAVGVPQYGAQYAGDAFAFCERRTTKTISGEENNRPNFVIVSCTFTTISVDKRDEEQSPLEKRPDIVWGSQFERIVATNARRIRTVQGGQQNDIQEQKVNQVFVGQFNQWDFQITNSSGKFFNPQPEIDVPYPIVTIVQNLSRDQWDPITNAKLVGATNLNSFRVDGVKIEKEQALLLDRTARTMYQGKLSFREVTTTLLFKNTHDLIIGDQGFMVWKKTGDPRAKSSRFGGGENDFMRVVAKQAGENTPEQVPLDGKGNELLGIPIDAKAVFIHFQVFQKLDFTSLNLPAEKQ